MQVGYDWRSYFCLEYGWRFWTWAPFLLQDSPNKKGVMGSKASGEPSLLLTTSVLYALRNAVKAARESFKALQSTSRPNVDLTLRDSAPGNSSSDEENSPQRSHLEHTNSAELVDGLDTRCNDGFDKEEYFQFEAPATTVRLKQVSLPAMHAQEILWGQVSPKNAWNSSIIVWPTTCFWMYFSRVFHGVLCMNFY